MPTQMPSTGRPAANRSAMIFSPPTSRSPVMHASYAPTPGHHQAVGRCRRSRIGRHLDRGADPLQRALSRPQVARAVVEDDHRLLGHRVPLVDGTPGHPRIGLDGLAQRAGDRLVLGLGDVVRIAAVERAHVQRDARVHGERLEHVPVDDGVVRRLAAGNREVQHVIRLAGVHAVRPAGHVDGGVRQRLVHRDERVAEPADALLVAERLAERLAQHDRGVLDGVVSLDLDVALGVHRQVEARVAAERGQHVVVERDAGADVGLSGAVEVEFDDDVGFLGLAFDSRGGSPESSSCSSEVGRCG